MATLNFKHLRYFWMVAKSGSIARASERLHLTPQAISGQLTEFAQSLNVTLFRRSGRGLELTDAGRKLIAMTPRRRLGQAEDLPPPFAGLEYHQLAPGMIRPRPEIVRIARAHPVDHGSHGDQLNR